MKPRKWQWGGSLDNKTQSLRSSQDNYATGVRSSETLELRFLIQEHTTRPRHSDQAHMFTCCAIMVFVLFVLKWVSFPKYYVELPFFRFKMNANENFEFALNGGRCENLNKTGYQSCSQVARILRREQLNVLRKDWWMNQYYLFCIVWSRWIKKSFQPSLLGYVHMYVHEMFNQSWKWNHTLWFHRIQNVYSEHSTSVCPSQSIGVWTSRENIIGAEETSSSLRCHRGSLHTGSSWRSQCKVCFLVFHELRLFLVQRGTHVSECCKNSIDNGN